MEDVKQQTGTGKLLATGVETAAALLDIVYVVRPGEENESLRYSLRSLEHVPHGEVYISGGYPHWGRGMNWIAKNTHDMEMPDQEDSNLNLYLAAQQPTLSDDFIFMNDDFFILKDISEIPVAHQGLLTERIESYKAGNRFHQAYSLIKTRQELLKLGLGPDLLSYELHIPMVMNKHKLIAMFNHWEQPLFALRPRTMYGNLYKLNGVKTADAKESINPEGQFLSSGADFDISIAGEYTRNKFRTPSPYEQAVIAS